MGLQFDEKLEKIWLRLFLKYLQAKTRSEKRKIRAKMTILMLQLCPDVDSEIYQAFNRRVTDYLRRLKKLEHQVWLELLDGLLEIGDMKGFLRAKKVSPFKLIGLARTNDEQNDFACWCARQDWPQPDRGDKFLILGEVLKMDQNAEFKPNRPLVVGFDYDFVCAESVEKNFRILVTFQGSYRDLNIAETDSGDNHGT